METVGILVVSYGSREAAIVDALTRSAKYKVELYIADKQRNPFNIERAKEHVVVPGLDVKLICDFAKKHKDELDFGIVGPEKPIIDGVRDLIEKETGIPVICPTKQYAIEASKVAQRQLLEEVVPEANPKFKIFDPKIYGERKGDLINDIQRWIDELGGVEKTVIKPDKPGFGKGVGVGGEHYSNFDQAREIFFGSYGGETQEKVIIEEKLDGEESSFQAFCDGKSLVLLPETRDNKRAFDGDRGSNTGGMGSYKDKGDWLPFMAVEDREKEIEMVNKLFNHMKGSGANPELRGIPFYVAFIHTATGPKILEINSRPGDPEIQNILPIIKDDFVDICYDMINGTLKQVQCEEKATVTIYKVPPTYGGYAKAYTSRVITDEIGKPVNLEQAKKLTEKYGSNIRIYPGSMELRNDGQTYALTSRTVNVVGIAEEIQTARAVSLEGIEAIRGGALWNRTDIASKNHVDKSMEHMRKIRGAVF